MTKYITNFNTIGLSKLNLIPNLRCRVFYSRLHSTAAFFACVNCVYNFIVLSVISTVSCVRVAWCGDIHGLVCVEQVARASFGYSLYMA